MVSKVAVIALVAIVACPILMGYVMNLDETTKTDYRPSDTPVDVTPLMLTGLDYTYAHADVIDLNTKFTRGMMPKAPTYITYGTTKTALPLSGYIFENDSWYDTTALYLADFSYYSMTADYNALSTYLNMTVHFNDGNGNTWTTTKSSVHSVYWDSKPGSFVYTRHYLVDGQLVVGLPEQVTPVDQVEYITYSTGGGPYTATTQVTFNNTNWTSYYVDISAGLALNEYVDQSPAYDNSMTLDVPDPRSVLITMDLGTIAAASHTFYMSTYYHDYKFVKSTDGGGDIHWYVYDNSTSELMTELYYDNTKVSNTYQIKIDGYGIDFRYVDTWPTFIGAANYYLNYYFGTNLLYEQRLKYVTFTNNTPLMRIDDAEYRAFKYQVIEDGVHNPGAFKQNPITTLKDVTRFGTSITFGGETFPLDSSGNITLGTRKISVNNLQLSSVPVIGGYENRIGNTVISTTASPSWITLNGKWSADVVTDSLKQTTYTTTEWTPGHFGWDGMDQNFLMVGLLTSIGVFIALSLYVRRTGSGLWPLLIVCGGAVILFFIML